MAREVHRRAVQGDPVLSAVHDQASGLESRVDAPAASHGAHAGGKLPHGERLDDVVVRAELQPDDAVGLVPPCRGDDHRHVGRPPQLAQDGQPVAVGQAQVQQDDVDVLRGEHHVTGIDDVIGLDAVARQSGQQRLGHGRIVLDDEHPHGPIVARPRGDPVPMTLARRPGAGPYSRLTSARAPQHPRGLPSSDMGATRELTATELSFRAMGTDCHVLAYAPDLLDDPSVVDEIGSLARTRVELLEQSWSRFRPSSELSRLNDRAGTGPHEVSADLLLLVERMRAAWEATAGLFDPTVLTSMRALGYDADFATVVARAASLDDVRLAAAPGMSGVRIDLGAGTVDLPAGIGLDPGAIGKGLAADIICVGARRGRAQRRPGQPRRRHRLRGHAGRPALVDRGRGRAAPRHRRPPAPAGAGVRAGDRLRRRSPPPPRSSAAGPTVAATT